MFFPKIGITVGDPAGIGAEVTLKALVDKDIQQICRPVIIGDEKFVRRSAKDLGLDLNLVSVHNEKELLSNSDERVLIYDVPNLSGEIVFGEVSAQGGRASAEYIETAVKLCRSESLNAMTTAPINKKSLHLGGYNFPGHTEFLAALSETEEFAMSFASNRIKVVLLSTHVSLLDAIKLITVEDLARLIRLTDRELKKLGVSEPRIAVAGINPHASEDGLFGTEEAEKINPAVEICRREGINVRGAFSADTIFVRAARGEFDVVVSCYHDQATIAVKCLSFGEAVNVTLGLPFIRTSVDHGTAYEIAGKNLADASSMKAAIRMAVDLSRGRQSFNTQNFR